MGLFGGPNKEHLEKILSMDKDTILKQGIIFYEDPVKKIWNFHYYTPDMQITIKPAFLLTNSEWFSKIGITREDVQAIYDSNRDRNFENSYANRFYKKLGLVLVYGDIQQNSVAFSPLKLKLKFADGTEQLLNFGELFKNGNPVISMARQGIIIFYKLDPQSPENAYKLYIQNSLEYKARELEAIKAEAEKINNNKQ